MDRFVVKRPLLLAEEAIDQIQPELYPLGLAEGTEEEKRKCCSSFSQHGHNSLLRELGK